VSRLDIEKLDDWYRGRDMTRHLTMTEALESWCSAGFPYVCMGEKVINPDQSVSCECGNVTINREDYERILLDKKK
jgi:hypothetical protein